ncbi:hypothetical protein TrCOL_g5206, partial [Triparma columacea]
IFKKKFVEAEDEEGVFYFDESLYLKGTDDDLDDLDYEDDDDDNEDEEEGDEDDTDIQEVPRAEKEDEDDSDDEDGDGGEGKEEEKFEKDSKVEGGDMEEVMRTKEEEEDEEGGKGKDKDKGEEKGEDGKDKEEEEGEGEGGGGENEGEGEDATPVGAVVAKLNQGEEKAAVAEAPVAVQAKDRKRKWEEVESSLESLSSPQKKRAVEDTAAGGAVVAKLNQGEEKAAVAEAPVAVQAKDRKRKCEEVESLESHSSPQKKRAVEDTAAGGAVVAKLNQGEEKAAVAEAPVAVQASVHQETKRQREENKSRDCCFSKNYRSDDKFKKLSEASSSSFFFTPIKSFGSCKLVKALKSRKGKVAATRKSSRMSKRRR